MNLRERCNVYELSENCCVFSCELTNHNLNTLHKKNWCQYFVNIEQRKCVQHSLRGSSNLIQRIGQHLQDIENIVSLKGFPFKLNKNN